MENDYYLHNFNVESFGSFTSMQSHRLAFGIPEMSIDNSEVLESPKSYSSLISKRGPGKAAWREKDTLTALDKRCQAQSMALSMWWKTALQENIQQRRWMRSSLAPERPATTSRLERVYQPEKLEQFDRVFSKVWEIPVRRSHATQHADGIEDEDLSDLIRVMSHPGHDRPEAESAEPKCGQDSALRDVLSKGTVGKVTPLAPFTRHFEASGMKQGRCADYIGGNESTRAPEEYIRYCSSQFAENAPYSYPLEKVAEFKKVLHENSLHFDDVAGIREMSKSANIGSTILTGEYWGLSKEHSAIEAATAIHEQFNTLENFPETGKQLIEKELERR